MKQKVPKRLNKKMWGPEEVAWVTLQGKPENVKLTIDVAVGFIAKGEEQGAWMDLSLSTRESIEILQKTVPPFIEAYCPEEYREDVYGTLEALGVGFLRPVVPHEELHGDRGYEE